MKRLLAMAALAVCSFVLSGCFETDSSGSSYIPPAPQPTPISLSLRADSAHRSLYVTDSGMKTLRVYDLGTRRLARSVALPAGPSGIDVDVAGNVYVSRFDSTVSVFAPGATRQMGKITNGIYEPGAVTIDSAGNLYVVNQYQGNLARLRDQAQRSARVHSSAGNTYISEYSPGARSLTRQIVAPPGTSFCGGVAVASDGTVYAVTLIPPDFGAFVVEAWPTFQVETMNLGGCGGLAMGSDGDIIGGSLGVVQTDSPAFRRVRWQDLEPNSGITLLSNRNGVVAVPFTNPNDGEPPTVLLETSVSGAAPVHLVLPTGSIPRGAVVGP